MRMLRRMKEDHLKGLPSKDEYLIEREMPAEQAAAYDKLVGSAVGSGAKMMAILQLLQGFRKVSLLAGELGEVGLTDREVAASARLSAMMEILDRVRDRGEKALVFVEFLAVQGCTDSVPAETLSDGVTAAQNQWRSGRPHPEIARG